MCVDGSGGGENTSYYSSLSYTKDDGRLKKNSFKRYSGRVNLTQKVGRFLDFTTNVCLARITKSGYNDTRTTGNNYFMQTRNLLWGLYWPTDYATGEDWTTRYGSYAYNGLYYDKEWDNKSTDTRVSAVETVTLHLFDGLDLRSIFSYDNTNVRDHLYYSANHFNGSSSDGSIDEMRTNYEKWVSSTTASYNKSFGDHTIGQLFGFEAEKNTTDYTRSSGTHLPNSTLHTVSTAGTLSAAGYQWAASWSRQYGTESIFELGIDTEADLGTTSLGFYYMRAEQKRNAMGWFLASNYFLNRLGQDSTDVRWGVMDNYEYGSETGATHRGACYKYLRLSEVYLIAAEAALHTGDRAAAAAYLNAIRCRAPKLAPATAETVSDDMILDERSKELFGEGLRFFDMIRMNKTIEYNDDMTNVPVSHRAKTIDRTFGGIVLPISQDEINANPSLADEQNEYYK